MGGLFSGIITAGLFVLASGAIVNGNYLNTCQRNIATQESNAVRYGKTCDNYTDKIKALDAKVVDAQNALKATGLTRSQTSRLNYNLKTAQRNVRTYSSLKTRYCKYETTAAAKAVTLKQQCTVVGTPTPAAS